MNTFMDESDDERPHKRRLVEQDTVDILSGLLHEEVDVEIGLRERLSQTAEYRLTWALVLRNALDLGESFEQSEARNGLTITDTFTDSALTAFKATSGPSALLLPQSPIESTAWTNNAFTEHLNIQNTIQEPVRVRHTPRNLAQASLGPSRGPLFLRDASSTPPLTYKLVCIDCGRSDFPRLQGMLNHCRLKHGREFGSHDECVQACAQVIQDEEEQRLVEANGSEVLGMSASLKRLFEMAVGQHSGVVLGLISDELTSIDTGATNTEDNEGGSTLISRTLGHHKDTPALAPFLGREPKKRQIHVYDDEGLIDILQESKQNIPILVFRQKSLHRPCLEPIDDEQENDTDSVDDEVERHSELFSAIPKSLSGTEGSSRFHMTVRIIVSDWSLRLTEDDSKADNTIHKWMISIRTPSYGIDASTVMKKVTIACASTPTPSSFELSGSGSVLDPPYCVLGLSDRSFLARISIEWVGNGEQSINPATTIDHWVEIDGNRTLSSRPTLGEEQVLDIELDRRTEVVPKRPDTWKVDWNLNNKDGTKRKDGKSEVGGEEKEPEDTACLKKLLNRFPLTAQEHGPRKLPPPVPYFLPSTSRHLSSLVFGRRKAIEWGRARALWDALSAARSSIPGANLLHHAREKTNSNDIIEDSENRTAKITGPIDVYRWMVSEGHLSDASEPRSQSKANFQSKSIAETQSDNTVFCALCGLPPHSHRRGRHRIKDDGDGRFRICEVPEWAGRRPLVDVEEMKALVEAQRVRSQLPENKRRSQHEGKGRETAPVIELGREWTNQDLVKSVDPRVTLAVQRIVGTLALQCAPKLEIEPNTHASHETVEDSLAPHALLGIATQIFIKKLLASGTQALESGTKSAASNATSTDRMLTPAHIIKGLVEASRRRTAKDGQRALLLSVARLGLEMRETSELVMETISEKEKEPQFQTEPMVVAKSNSNDQT